MSSTESCGQIHKNLRSKVMSDEAKLEQLEQAHQAILDAAGEGIYGLDRDGEIVFSNAAATRILGWKLEDVLGQRSHDVHHHSHADGKPYPIPD